MRFICIVFIFTFVPVSGSFYDELQGAMHSVQHGFGKLLSDVVYDVTDTVHCTISAVEQVLTLNGLISTKSAYGHRCRDGPLPPIETRDNDPLENFLRTREALEEESFGDASPNLLHNSIAKMNKTLTHALDNQESQRKIESISKVLKDETEQLTKVSNILRQELNSISKNVNSELNKFEHDLGPSGWTERELERKNRESDLHQTSPSHTPHKENNENKKENDASETFNNAKQQFENKRDKETASSNQFPKDFRDVARNIREKSQEDSKPKKITTGSVFNANNGFDQFSSFFDPGNGNQESHEKVIDETLSIIKDSEHNEQILDKVFKQSHTAADVFALNPRMFHF